jgi:hypothetical protein
MRLCGQAGLGVGLGVGVALGFGVGEGLDFDLSFAFDLCRGALEHAGTTLEASKPRKLEAAGPPQA